MNPTGSFRSLDDWLSWLEGLSPVEIVLGLERVYEVLARLGLRQPDTVVTVAGTNGKGSSVAMLEALFRAGGAATGAYSSPHLIAYNERIRIAGREADDDVIVAAFERVESVRNGVPLTYFEFGTLAALAAFDAAGADTWLLEVGMGGRLDAVNAIDADASLITNVSLDHCAWLGPDVESIAREKSGIMRAGRPTVYGASDLPQAVTRQAGSCGAGLLVAGRDFGFDADAAKRWTWRGQRTSLRGLAVPALAGRHQLDNASAVLAVIEALGRDDLLHEALISPALESLALPGRFQRVDERFVLDVAHNPGAMQILAQQLAALAPRSTTAVLGMLADKDVAASVAPLAGVVDRWIAVSLPGARGTPAFATGRDIANATGGPCRVIEDIGAAMAVADAGSQSGDIVLVAGSFYVVGPALEWLQTRIR